MGNDSRDGSKRTIEGGKLSGAPGLYCGNENATNVFAYRPSRPISEQSLRISLSSLAALSNITLSSSLTAEQKIDLQQRLLTNLLEWMPKNRGVAVVIGACGA